MINWIILTTFTAVGVLHCLTLKLPTETDIAYIQFHFFFDIDEDRNIKQ